MEKITLYTTPTRQIAFEGSVAEAWKWLIAQADRVNGCAIYRTWIEDGEHYYDVGRVYCTNADLQQLIRNN